MRRKKLGVDATFRGVDVLNDVAHGFLGRAGWYY
jgi:hypothetical protein